VKRALPLLVALAVLLLAPIFLEPFRLGLLGKFLTFAIVALGLDLVWGYTGMLSLGQGVFFGMGAYAAAMYLKLASAGGELPDFMLWSGLREMPAFWRPFANPVFAFSVAIIAPTLMAAAMGFLVGRSRITGVYFSLLTQALALIVTILLIGQQPFTGGTNGMTNFASAITVPPEGLYLLTVAALAVAFVLCQGVVRSRFGRLLIAIRDDENRVRFCGYDPVEAKVLVLGLSGALAGLGGALFVLQVGIISPAMLGIVPSIEMVIWVAVGGRGTLIGAVIGAVAVNAAKSALSESFPDIWQIFLGLMLVAVVVAFPRGLVGAAEAAVRRLRVRLTPIGVPAQDATPAAVLWRRS
jgi:urea transport system permease protein